MDGDPTPSDPTPMPLAATPPTAAPPGDPTSTPLAATPPAAAAPGVTPLDDGWFDTADPASDIPARRGVKAWVAAGVGAAVLVAASVLGVSVASSHTTSSRTSGPGAQLGGPGQGAAAGFGGLRGATLGTITAVDGTTLTIETQAGTSTKVTTTSATVVTVSSTGTLRDIATGDHLLVMGTASGTTVTAAQVVDRGASTASSASPLPGGPVGGGPVGGGQGVGPGGNGGGAPVLGTVSKISGTTITLTSASGTTSTIDASSATVVIERIGSVSALKTGESVVVTGTHERRCDPRREHP